jgi:hypothetical protein
MKPIKTLLLLAALFMLMPVACKKSSPKPQTAAVSMTFKFNGTAETATLVVATYYKSQNSVQIAGSIGSSQALGLMIDNIKTGTFDLATDPTILATYSTALDFDHTYTGTTGTIVITTFTSDAIAGTFQFSGMNGLSQTGAVTEGSFSAKLITE